MTNENEIALTNFRNYAIDIDNNLVDIQKATKEKEYYCIECGTRLNIRDGEIRVKHFYHLNTVECDNESYLHKVYKKVIENCKRIHFYDYFLKKPINIIFDFIKLEYRIDNIIADCYGIVKKECSDYAESQIIIEIYHTHEVDNKKLKKIQNYNIFCIEIRAIQFRTIEEIENYITGKDYYGRSVLHNPFENSAMQKLITENEKLKESITYWKNAFLSEVKIRKSVTKRYKKIYLNFSKICRNGAYFYTHKKELITAFVDKKDNLKNSLLTIIFADPEE
jgi:hypothetical protein